MGNHQAALEIVVPARNEARRLPEGSAARRVYRRHACVAVSPSTVTAMRERLLWISDIYPIPNGTAQPPFGAVARSNARDLVWVVAGPDGDVLAGGPVLDRLIVAGAEVRREATPLERLTGPEQPAETHPVSRPGPFSSLSEKRAQNTAQISGPVIDMCYNN